MDVVELTPPVDGMAQRALESESHLLVGASRPLVEGVDLQPDTLEPELAETEVGQGP